MSETSKDYKQIEYDNWLAKSKKCPLKLSAFRCSMDGIEHCNMDSCPIYYWTKI